MFSDGLAPGWEDWSWDVTALDLCDTTEVYDGACSAAVDLGAWGGLSFYHAPFSGRAWDTLTFFIHGGTAGGQQLQVLIHDRNGVEQPPVSLSDPAYIEGGEVVAGVWKPVTFPLAALLQNAKNGLSRVTIKAVGEQPPFFIDAMKLLESTAILCRPATATMWAY